MNIKIKKIDCTYERDGKRDGKYCLGFHWDTVYAIMQEETEIGLIFLSDGIENNVYIEWAELYEEYRGKGYFKRVIECLKEEFRNKEYLAFESNDEHIAMYEHLNAEKVSYDEIREMTEMRFSIKKTLQNVKEIKLTTREENGTTVYATLIDNTHNIGILRSTNELSLEFTLDSDGNARIHSGWEFNCGGDWTWTAGEEAELEQEHPGLLNELSMAAKKLGKAA